MLVLMDAVVMLITRHVVVTRPQGVLQHVIVMLIALLLMIAVLMLMVLVATQTLMVIIFMITLMQ